MSLSPGEKQRQVGGHVGVGARVRLHVRVVGAEQRARTLAGQLLGLVDHQVAAVVALARVALGVLVREHRALRLEHRGRGEVLGRDQLDRGVLALTLAPDDVGDRGISGFQRVEAVGHCRSPGRLRCSRGGTPPTHQPP